MALSFQLKLLTVMMKVMKRRSSRRLRKQQQSGNRSRRRARRENRPLPQQPSSLPSRQSALSKSPLPAQLRHGGRKWSSVSPYAHVHIARRTVRSFRRRSVTWRVQAGCQSKMSTACTTTTHAPAVAHERSRRFVFCSRIACRICTNAIFPFHQRAKRNSLPHRVSSAMAWLGPKLDREKRLSNTVCAVTGDSRGGNR